METICCLCLQYQTIISSQILLNYNPTYNWLFWNTTSKSVGAAAGSKDHHTVQSSSHHHHACWSMSLICLKLKHTKLTCWESPSQLKKSQVKFQCSYAWLKIECTLTIFFFPRTVSHCWKLHPWQFLLGSWVREKAHFENIQTQHKHFTVSGSQVFLSVLLSRLLFSPNRR